MGSYHTDAISCNSFFPCDRGLETNAQNKFPFQKLDIAYILYYMVQITLCLNVYKLWVSTAMNLIFWNPDFVFFRRVKK